MEVQIKRDETTPVPDTAYYERPTRAIPITKVEKLGQPYASVHYGPLLFALAQPDETPDKASEGVQWQYALNLVPGNASQSEIDVIRSAMPERFQWQLDSPLKLRVPAVEFDWNPTNTQPLPDEAVEGEETKITLVPYGTTKFRISMFPISTKMENAAETSAQTSN